MWRARGDFDRGVRDEGLRLGARPVGQIVADYRRLAGSRRTPPGVNPATALLDVLVHTDDILAPLGRPRPMPPDAAAACAEQVWRHSFPFRARTRLRGLRLTASDADWSAGAGTPVSGPIASLLLVLTGRSAGLHGLTGAGLEDLRERIAQT
jgi:uncharacterized protein (TIGR03083 family)